MKFKTLRQYAKLMLVSCALGCLPNAAAAKCSALPILSEILDHIATLEKQASRAQTISLGNRIGVLTDQINRASIERTLTQFGLERHTETINAFKTRTGTLSQIAAAGNPSRVSPYLNGSEYQRTVRATQDVVHQVCDTSGGTDPSDAATWQISVFGSGGTLSQFATVSVPTVAGIGVSLVLGLFWLLRRNGRRKAKEARINKRSACDIPVIVTADGGAHFLRVVDISRGGVNIAGARDWKIGNCIDIDFGTMSRKAIVRWRNDHFSGLQFTENLTANEQSILLTDYCELKRPRIKGRGNLEGAAP